MHQDNMLKVRESALALLKGQKSVLQQIRNTPGLAHEAAEGQARLLDNQRLADVLEVLDGEISKVENLEMVIAVVGTMKAGKSTTINAVAGTEVLPNRNQPMTTMPTLIRHTPGYKEPVLTFPKTGPIVALEAGVRDRLGALQGSTGLDVLETWHHDDGRELIARILEGRGDWISGRHVGVDNIFTVLRDLNDLVRLAREVPVGLSLTEEDYDEIHELPFIEVEFTHLAKTTGDGLGRLTLLDTPGPNEAGQGDALLNIMKEQLEKASAVLAVLDYTQLRSTADEQVRRILTFLSSQLEDRTFALVNRFDQHTANSMGEAEVKGFVTKALLDIEEERVFPASARWAYLSNRLLTALEAGENVQNFKDAPWFRDFANLANMDEEELGDKDELIRQAKKFWRKSHFEPLLDQVISRGHQQAAQICVEAALAKMSVYGGVIEEFLALRKGGITQEVTQLQRMVDELRSDVLAAETAEKKAEASLRGMTEQFTAGAKAIHAKAQEQMRKKVDEYFREGKIDEKKRIERKNAIMVEEQRRRPKNLLGPLLWTAQGLSSDDTGKRDFDPSSDKVTFDTPSEAEDFSRKIAQRIASIMADAVKESEWALEDAASNLRRELGEVTREEVGVILHRAQQTLKGGGIDLTISFPAPDFNADQTASISDGEFDAVKTRSYSVTRRREKGGVFSWIARKLWDGGYEKYEVQLIEATVSLEAIRRGVEAKLNHAVGNIHDQASEFVKGEIEPAVSLYFSRLRRHLEAYRTVLLDGIQDQEGAREGLAELRRHIEDVAEQAGMHRQELNYLARLAGQIQQRGAAPAMAQ